MIEVGGVLTAFGLSGAAGLNACLPLLAVGLLGRFGGLDLSPSFAFLAEPWMLVLLGVLFVLDTVGDKIPAVDHVLHGIGVVAYPVAGAVAFASQTGAVERVSTPVALVLGLVTAGGIHATRAGVRPASTAATAGIGNPVLSAAEDVVSFVLTALALVVPVLAVVLLVAVAAAAVLTVRRLLRAARPGRRPPPPTRRRSL